MPSLIDPTVRLRTSSLDAVAELLGEAGGHIGYDVRPSARRRGHARAMLAAALPLANALGIPEALLTCDETNVASRRVIEANGGRYIGSVGEKRRYRVPTSG